MRLRFRQRQRNLDDLDSTGSTCPNGQPLKGEHDMRNIRPRLFAPWLVLSLSALLALGAVGCRNPALANESEDECSIANVAGTYGFVGFGQLLPTNAFNLPPGPESNVGRFALDGRGSFVLVETVRVSVGGTDQFINPHESGTYTVDAGCNFTLTGSIPPFIPDRKS